MRSDFCIFILTHGRADRVATFKMLREFKYTGRVYVVVDDEDSQRLGYLDKFGDKVLVFSKEDVASEFDEADNFEDRRSVFYARNACWELARQVGVKYFMQMDDDYRGAYLRWNGSKIGVFRAQCLDAILEAMIDYSETIPALSIAMSQGGDHIGGFTANHINKRKAMNTFLCSVERPFRFVGKINEDVSTYTSLGRRGDLFLTIPVVQINQPSTQQHGGGMTELYQDAGTYVKSFYSVMITPSSVKIGELRDTRSNRQARLHHAIDWERTIPQILPERYRKAI